MTEVVIEVGVVEEGEVEEEEEGEELEKWVVVVMGQKLDSKKLHNGTDG